MTDYVDTRGLADMAGITPATARSYRSQGRLPEPDVMVGVSPGWRPETVWAWLAARPGRTGRPRKTA